MSYQNLFKRIVLGICVFLNLNLIGALIFMGQRWILDNWMHGAIGTYAIAYYIFIHLTLLFTCIQQNYTGEELQQEDLCLISVFKTCNVNIQFKHAKNAACLNLNLKKMS